MNIEIWKLLNCDVNECFRQIELKFFDDAKHKKIDWIKFSFCCHICDFDFRFSIETFQTLNKMIERDFARRSWYDKKLTKWRKNQIQTLFEKTEMQYIFSFIMSNETMKVYATWIEYIHDEKNMRKWIDEKWMKIKMN